MEAQLNTESFNKKIKLDFKDSKYATGRRKKSIAKVWLKKGSGIISVNGKKWLTISRSKIYKSQYFDL